MEERTEYQKRMLDLILNGSPRAPRRPKVGGYRSEIIPTWAVGDVVRHRPTGTLGKLTEMMTDRGELWKLLPRGARAHVVVHARDLQLENAP